MDEIETYIRDQRTLGVKDHAIKKSLIDAGYKEEEIAHKFTKAHHALELRTSHLAFLLIISTVMLGSIIAYQSIEYNKRLTEVKNETDEQVASLQKNFQDKIDLITMQTSQQNRQLSDEIAEAKSGISSAETRLSSQIQDLGLQSMVRDNTLTNSIQALSNHSTSELTSLQDELSAVKKTTVDFSPVIPNAQNAVVTIGVKEGLHFTTKGSGVVVNSKGYIVTNDHVIDDLPRIAVRVHSGSDYTATVVGRNPDWDIAVIKLSTAQDGFTSLEFADSNKLTVGQRVIAVGNPIGLESTVTEGIISNTRRLLPGEIGIYYIQTDVAINSGNSGGPLIDQNGKIIGINTMKYAQVGFEGLSFALRSNDVQREVMAILADE